jgi:geranylgeranyl pyrophosphate synthase
MLEILGNGIGENGFHKIREYVTESGGIEYAYRRAAEIANNGTRVVHGMKESAYHSSLLGLVEFSTSRIS